MVLVAGASVPTESRANAVVTVCGNADQGGPGLNLRKALLASPDPNSLINVITFNCTSGLNIRVDTPLTIDGATSIDGGGRITIEGERAEGTINVVNAKAFLYLRNLTLHHQLNPPTAKCTNWLGGCVGSIVNGQGVTELHNVTVENANRPIAITGGLFAVYDSHFSGNTESVIVASSGVTATVVSNSYFTNNSSASPLKAAGSINIQNSQFSGNDTSYFDAFAGAGSTCRLTIEGGVFEANVLNGAVSSKCNSTISHSTFSNNASSQPGGALALSLAGADITLRRDIFLNNKSALDGGAVYWQPPSLAIRTMNVLYSTFTGNSAQQGGAIAVAKASGATGASILNVSVSAFSRNSARVAGGAISAASSHFNVARATFADNAAKLDGGAVYLDNPIGLESVIGNALMVRNSAETGSALFGSNLSLINSTIDSNQGMAIEAGSGGAKSPVRLSNTIVSNNTKGGCQPSASIVDGGKNLQFPKSDCGKSIAVADPQLDTMYIPLPKSPPMGNGSLKVCMTTPINGRDVYGTSRPSGGVCTIGAAEGDITVLTHNQVNGHQGPGQHGNNCPCGTSLLQQLERLLPFNP